MYKRVRHSLQLIAHNCQTSSEFVGRQRPPSLSERTMAAGVSWLMFKVPKPLEFNASCLSIWPIFTDPSTTEDGTTTMGAF
ncbi:hypothetical protein JZ751_004088 [Albula glossodonta]|uniref:Uncharacterized protein n=1 Tax=Albula glossodonta TaxID=121402 RepID=A0A8T2P3P6_9TELE|nr:hypothetical protein JZ751_004088 [Albula glossodonta]